ncbi:MAG: hypothetical protein JRI93_10330 [Deltaproteobacteria bacterium]|nr:hypothetical protein [Deltaproteobacteria bacterium]
MQQITLRGISPEIEKKIRRIAKEDHISINQVIKEIVHKEFGMAKQQPRASSLRKLAGGWSREEADAFETTIRSCQQIDAEMWQ